MRLYLIFVVIVQGPVRGNFCRIKFKMKFTSFKLNFKCLLLNISLGKLNMGDI